MDDDLSNLQAKVIDLMVRSGADRRVAEALWPRVADAVRKFAKAAETDHWSSVSTKKRYQNIANLSESLQEAIEGLSFEEQETLHASLINPFFSKSYLVAARDASRAKALHYYEAPKMLAAASARLAERIGVNMKDPRPHKHGRELWSTVILSWVWATNQIPSVSNADSIFEEERYPIFHLLKNWISENSHVNEDIKKQVSFAAWQKALKRTISQFDHKGLVRIIRDVMNTPDTIEGRILLINDPHYFRLGPPAPKRAKRGRPQKPKK
jgi:hypothetical protein